LFVQICTIALLLLSRRAIPPRYGLFFAVVFAGGFSALWSMFAEAFMPDIFHTLLFYPFLLPAMLPILLTARTLPQSHGRQAPVLSVLLTGFVTCFILCIIALLRESIGLGTVLGHPIHPRPLFTWAASTPGALTLAALITGIFAIFHRWLTPSGVRP
jgi:Na+-translocating ferredoxin:NAD+ oxidoreductase RnfE subunit